MIRPRKSLNGRAVRLAGLAVLALAFLAGRQLVAIGIGRSGHEPAIAYLLALLTFAGASVGAALATMGSGLIARVTVAERWLPHVPAAFREMPIAPTLHNVA
jgi:hypothetical protein